MLRAAQLGRCPGVLRIGGIRLGVTGLSRARKTVFITSSVASLLNRGRMLQLLAASEGRIQPSFLQPQPDYTLARFDYEANLDSLLRPAPQWPEGTQSINQLRLSFRLAPQGIFAAMAPPKTLHLDIVDYPGEWLLDLGLLDLTFDQWSEPALQAADGRAQAKAYRFKLTAVDGAKPFDDVTASELAKAYAAYLIAAHMLLPGDLAGSPVLNFAPLPAARATGDPCARKCGGGLRPIRKNSEDVLLRPFCQIGSAYCLVGCDGNIDHESAYDPQDC